MCSSEVSIMPFDFKKEHMLINKLSREEIGEALPLIWNVFCEYEAVNYSESGKLAFWQAIHSADYLNELTAYGAFHEDKLIGIIATRKEGSHIALFFVDGQYHGCGVGRRLFEACMENNTNARITVNSSEYAVDIYKKLGFVPEDEMHKDGGIRYIPMVLERLT